MFQFQRPIPIVLFPAHSQGIEYEDQGVTRIQLLLRIEVWRMPSV